MQASDVIKFWFEDIETSQWWTKDKSFDNLVRDKFSAIHERAKNCELFSWRETAEGRLAEIIVLDQFSRNMYRDQPQAFAQDPLALALAQEAVARGADAELADKRFFLYMPYMHSESALVHEEAFRLFSQPGMSIEYEKKHRDIILKFGRYPHRNEILQRTSTPEEIEFLKQPNSSF